MIDEGGQFWENYCTVARELKSLENVLLADPTSNATGFPPLMSGRAWTWDGRTYLLVVNESEKPLSADLSLPSRFASVKAMNTLPSQSRFVLAGDKLHVEMEPIGVVMLKLEPIAADVVGIRTVPFTRMKADGWPAPVDTRWKGPNSLNTFGGKYWMMYLGGSADGYETNPLGTLNGWG